METKLVNFALEDIMGDRFGKYSKYIIQDRALPDVRDGMKPVQRRILYAMYIDGNTPDKPTRKSAKTVGYVMGNYHPHGDSSIYDAMVRMAQDWKQNVTLIDMQGNVGSIDDDPAAAMRYTEARLSPISMELLRDIKKNTVNMALTFDDTGEEPTVLPARFPNILVNGAKGIAAGYATEIPPHNLTEVINGAIFRIKNPKCNLDEIMNFIPAPDFPTGGIIRGKDGVREIFETGHGQFQISSKIALEETKNITMLIITEIPYDVIKSKLVQEIDRIRDSKEVEGILEVRDESGRNGLRIVVEMRKDADKDNIVNYLMKKTSLSIKYSANITVISEKRPCQLSLLSILDEYIAHQIDVVKRRTIFDLDRANERLNIVAGLVIAISNIDEVVAIIRASKDKNDAKVNLIKRFKFNEAQVEAIVMLQLYRLTSFDVITLEKEKNELIELVNDLKELYSDDKKIRKTLISEMEDISKRYATKRRSVVEDAMVEFNVEKKPIIKEDVIVTVTRDGYFKRTSIKSYAACDGILPGCKNGDLIIAYGQSNTANTLLAFTDKGNYLFVPVFELADIKWKDEGKHISNIISLLGDEKIISVFNVADFKDGIYVVLCSKKGLIKRTKIQELIVQRYSKPISCMNIDKDDAMVSVCYSDGDSSIVVGTKMGKIIHYHESKVSIIGPRARGVNAIKMAKDDYIANMLVINKGNKDNIIALTDHGGYKIFNPNNVACGVRLGKTSDIYKYYRSEPHSLVAFTYLNSDSKYSVLSSNQSSREITFDSTKVTTLGKSIKSTLLSSNDERFISISNYKLIDITANSKTYEYVDEKKIEVVTPNKEDNDEDENMTIFDYIDDL